MITLLCFSAFINFELDITPPAISTEPIWVNGDRIVISLDSSYRTGVLDRSRNGKVISYYMQCTPKF